MYTVLLLSRYMDASHSCGLRDDVLKRLKCFVALSHSFIIFYFYYNRTIIKKYLI